MIELPGLARPVAEDSLEDVACGLCGSRERTLQFADGPFNVVRCNACGLHYVTPRLKPGALIEAVYDEGYWSSNAAKDRGYTDYRADAGLYLATYRRRIQVVKRHFQRPGRVLDIGCAAGYFLSVMQGEGWDVVGYEPSDAIRTQAVERLKGAQVLGGDLESAPLEPNSFDLVTFWDVIEHVPDPIATLKFVASLLKPGGKLLIETQNVNSRAAKWMGKKWQHYKHAEHIYHFDPKTLGDLFQKAGFEVLENTPRLGGKYVSLGFIAERSARLSPIAAFLCSPLKLLSKRRVYINLYDEMIAVAKLRA